MENVTETKLLGLRWRHQTAAARIPQFFRSANTWDKEVSLSEREKWSLGQSVDLMDRILLCISKTFSFLHYVINAGLTRHTEVSTTPSHLGIRRDISNFNVLLSFGTVHPAMLGINSITGLSCYCKVCKTTKAAIPQAKKQTARVLRVKWLCACVMCWPQVLGGLAGWLAGISPRLHAVNR